MKVLKAIESKYFAESAILLNLKKMILNLKKNLIVIQSTQNNSFFQIYNIFNYPKLNLIPLFSVENGLNIAEQIVPTLAEKSKTPGPPTNSDLILKVDQPTTPVNTQNSNSLLSNLSLSKALESLNLRGESPAKLNGE